MLNAIDYRRAAKDSDIAYVAIVGPEILNLYRGPGGWIARATNKPGRGRRHCVGRGLTKDQAVKDALSRI